MNKSVSIPVAIVAVVAVLLVAWFAWSRMANQTRAYSGSEIQKPTGRAPDPADIPQGGTPPGFGSGSGTQNGPTRMNLPPGKGKR